MFITRKEDCIIEEKRRKKKEKRCPLGIKTLFLTGEHKEKDKRRVNWTIRGDGQKMGKTELVVREKDHERENGSRNTERKKGDARGPLVSQRGLKKPVDDIL